MRVNGQVNNVSVSIALNGHGAGGSFEDHAMKLRVGGG
jgi:hypothetical protein